MQQPDVAQTFDSLPDKIRPEEYNYDHFRTKHLARDGRRTLTDSGIQPGEPAPDFELTEADGGMVRLSDLRGKPVVLHFGSYS